MFIWLCLKLTLIETQCSILLSLKNPFEMSKKTLMLYHYYLIYTNKMIFDMKHK